MAVLSYFSLKWSQSITVLFQSSSRCFKTVPPCAVDRAFPSPLTTLPHSLSCVRIMNMQVSLINSLILMKTNFLVRLIFGWTTELHWLTAQLHNSTNTRKVKEFPLGGSRAIDHQLVPSMKLHFYYQLLLYITRKGLQVLVFQHFQTRTAYNCCTQKHQKQVLIFPSHTERSAEFFTKHIINTVWKHFKYTKQYKWLLEYSN